MNYKQTSSFGVKIVMAIFCLGFLSTVSANTSQRAYECDYYGRSATTQYKQNIQAGCGFKGLRWSDDTVGHTNWCKTVRKAITTKENATRETMLKACFTKKSLVSNTENYPNIPQVCKNLKQGYTPIKSIYSWYRYKKEIRTPVKDGLIKADFNHDNRPDYVFIERDNKHNIRLTTCISRHHYYIRKPTRITFSAAGDSLSSHGHYIELKEGQLVIRFTYFGHNEGSSSAEGYYVYNVNQQVFQLNDSISNSAGLPMAPDYKESYPIYTPVPPALL
jgi:hypothetical protein